MANKESIGKDIRLQIISSKSEKFYNQDLNEISTEGLDQNNIKFNVAIRIASNIKTKQLQVEVEIDATLKEDGRALFGIIAKSIYFSPDINKLVNKNNALIAPEEFMRKIINISIGGARGMLAVHLSKTDLSHITLPLLDTSSLKENRENSQ